MKRLNLFENTKYPITVSQFALGCNHFGMGIPEEQAFKIMDTFYELGGTLFDTAHSYSQKQIGDISLSELIVGKWIAANKLEGKVVVSDKGAKSDKNQRTVSRINEKVIKEELFSSLETMGMGCVDIWFLHRDNPAMPVGEIVDMVSELVDKGYIKHLGVSNWSVKRIAEALKYAHKNGKHGFEISQIQWSLAYSTPESWEDPTVITMEPTQYEWYHKEQFPLMCFSSQAHGIFSKVIERGVEAVAERSRKRFLLEQNMGRIENCRVLCEKYGVNPAGISLSYLTSAPFPVIPVLGCSKPEQIVDSLRFADFTLSEKDREFLIKD